ncbi:MAG: TldD/PmbA family protein [Candidatus Sericytochromatia bacterium]|nr:TldD/PmbA family protein [Candidatus Sericytochromatia bacterium]
MISETQALELLDGIIKLGGGDEVEAVLAGMDRGLTRYADNQIHQNVATTDASLILRVAVGKRVGVVTTNRLDPDSVRAALRRARELASLQPENPFFVGFADPQPIPPMVAAHPSTLAATAQDRAELIHVLAGMMRSEGLSACGRVSTTSTLRAIVNSRGVRAVAPMSEADMVAVVSSQDGGTGYASRVSPSFAALGVESLVSEVIETTRLAEDPVEVPIGAYDVVLSPYAAATLVEYLSHAGFGALSVLEGRSFLSDRMGYKITGDRISIWDDARDDEMPGEPFDWEGVPTRRVPLITGGTAMGMAHDVTTAARDEAVSTGHAQPSPNGEGPAPTHLVMAPGESQLADLVKQVKKGLLVTRFHYTNLVDPKRTLATGLTRDGLLIIADGEIVGAARNLRFTESILDAFSRCEGLTAETRIGGEFGTRVRAPGMLLRQFRFNGQAGS